MRKLLILTVIKSSIVLCVSDVICLKNSDCCQGLVKASGLIRHFCNGHLAYPAMFSKVIFSSCPQFLLAWSTSHTVIPWAALNFTPPALSLAAAQ